MAKAQKFGSFGGVFVPSVLTILGVIMYLRLGWVVGNAGLVGTIIIILIAHVISVTTGLSVSSIATDKKVKAGGIYYILSRSLGLPIGGAIGIALFVATALSIAMYIVGFGESFNNALGLSHPDMAPIDRINNLRITGTVTLIIVTTIALVSTSLAIKTQYYILGAIALSLISIFAGGLFTDHGLQASSVVLFSGEGSASLETVFAIFFPAVTGFTAGVAMSGDLKDPKKSIPVGTMAAIGVGLVVYIGLTIFLATSIDSTAMREDTNILAKIALFTAYGAPFLMAGIWGATLSSALGGILGGPRILQAMSLDKVTPKLFGKGVGKSNEPRNALLFSFVIAEAGILIGELDLIAPIVSMFYLTAYGFINLTSALESWSGSDFRPTFKIPRAVSWLGAFATFAVMFKLDMLAMFASFIVIGAIFLYLTRKQISLGFSDVWQGVWSEVVRTALSQISQKPLDKRSWRPNIILFSGSTERRPHLLEYGKRLVGKLGLLSNFDLVEDQSTDVVFVRREQPTEDGTEENKGVFTRRYSCKDVYSGIERIAETYGFSGLEPNTILIGWARYSKDPLRFSRLIQRFQELDYSLLIMDYDQHVGFGKRKRIDIWWEGQGRHVSFALTISRFLNTSDEWQDATIRLYILADTSLVDDMLIFETLDQIQEQVRVKLDVKIINTALDHRNYYDIIRSESSAADLIYLELPDLKEGSEEDFFTKTDALCEEIGTVILYKASKEFDPIDLGLDQRIFDFQPSDTGVSKLEADLQTNVPSLHLPDQVGLADNFQTLDGAVKQLVLSYHQNSLKPFTQKSLQLIETIHAMVSECYECIKEDVSSNSEKVTEFISNREKDLLDQLILVVQEFKSHELKPQAQLITRGLDEATSDINDIILKCPPQLLVEIDKQTLTKDEYQNLNWKQRLKSKWSDNSVEFALQFQKLAELQLKQNLQRSFFEVQKQINQNSEKLGGDLRKNIRRLAAGLHNLKIDNGNLPESLPAEVAQIDQRFQDLKEQISLQTNAYCNYLITDSRVQLQKLISKLDDLTVNKAVRSELGSSKLQRQLLLNTKDVLAAWSYNQPLNFNAHRLELGLIKVQNGLWQNIELLVKRMIEVSNQKVLQKLERLKLMLEKLRLQYHKGKPNRLSMIHEITDFMVLSETIKVFQGAVSELTKTLPERIQVPNVQASSGNPSEEEDAIEIAPRDLVKYLMETKLMSSLEASSNQLMAALQKSDHAILDVLQVMDLSISGVDDDLDSSPERIIETINEEIKRVQEHQDLVEQLLDQQIHGLEGSYKELIEDLNAHSIIKSALDFDYYLRSQKQTQVINKFAVITKNIKNYVLAGLTKVYYRRSEGIITAKRIQSRQWDAAARMDSLTRLMREIMPNPDVLEDLPFYYKQLFLKPHGLGKDFWIIRERDRVIADEAVSHYQQVKSGGLLILGAPKSGKTYLSEFVARSHFSEKNMFHITPPDSGSIDIQVFERAIKKSLKYYGDLDSVFDHLGERSVLIFNDIELWWERQNHGFKVIDYLMDIIRKYGNRCMFIVNMNIYSYQLLNAIQSIDTSFFKILKVDPYSAQDLKDIILARHRTSRLKFELNNKHEDELSKLKLAQLFTNYFDVSKGNVGNALQQWVSNISNISADGIMLTKHPKQPDTEVLRYLDKRHIVLLTQFILHKRIHIERLDRLFPYADADLLGDLEILKRSHVLTVDNNVWEINRYLQSYLIAAFEEDLLI